MSTPAWKVTSERYANVIEQYTAPITSRWKPGKHRGLDRQRGPRRSIFALHSGTVVSSTNSKLFGNIVVVKYAGGYDTYVHVLHPISFHDTVKAGERVGLVSDEADKSAHGTMWDGAHAHHSQNVGPNDYAKGLPGIDPEYEEGAVVAQLRVRRVYLNTLHRQPSGAMIRRYRDDMRADPAGTITDITQRLQKTAEYKKLVA